MNTWSYLLITHLIRWKSYEFESLIDALKWEVIEETGLTVVDTESRTIGDGE